MSSTEVALVDERSALAPTPRQSLAVLRPIVAAAAMIEAQKELATLVASALTEGTDYGTIPGTSKPTLMKPGAERLCVAFGLQPRFTVIEQEIDHERVGQYVKRQKRWNNAHRDDKTFTWVEEVGESLGLYRYVVRCELVTRETGIVVGEGIGSCSTLESKYADRPREVENTVLKMAQKRAHLAATLTTLGLSDRFTQDMEDRQHDTTETAATPRATSAAKPAAAKADAQDPGAMRMPGKAESFDGFGGKPLREVPTKTLAAAAKWLKAKDDPKNGTLVAAMEQLVAERAADEAPAAAPAGKAARPASPGDADGQATMPLVPVLGPNDDDGYDPEDDDLPF